MRTAAAALLGALLAAAGAAALIVAGRHHPVPASGSVLSRHGPSDWTPTTYDLVRVIGWALIIFGAVIVALALVRELRRAA
jgi:cell division protein FtsX